MPLLDPFSAASRPFVSFDDDDYPKNPLGFAETLQPIDTNTNAGTHNGAWSARREAHPQSGLENAPPLSESANDANSGQPAHVHAHVTRIPRDKHAQPIRPARQYAEPLPTAFPEPLFSHRRASSAAVLDMTGQLGGLTLPAPSSSCDTSRVHARGHDSPARGKPAEPEPGSDEWMKVQMARCVDAASRIIDFSRLGMKELSPRIADVQHLVTIAASRPPAVGGTYSPRIPSSPIPRGHAHASPLGQHHPRSPDHASSGKATDLHTPRAGSPGTYMLSADARPFARTVSAPASSAFFGSLNAGPSDGRLGRVPSGLRNGSLLESPTITEASDEVREDEVPASFVGSPLVTGSPGTPRTPRSPRVGGNSPFHGTLGVKRAMGRSKTGAVDLAPVSGKGIEIYLGHNQLTSLPSALFEISKLTVLILRNNHLEELPAAVGSLTNLKELNISGNKIRYLPSAILDLHLEIFSAQPNPFLPKPEPSPDLPPSGRLLSPLISHHAGSVLPLYSTCLNLLISPRGANDLPPLLEYYEFSPAPGQAHPLLDASALHSAIPQVPERDLEQVLQCMKSASTPAARARRSGPTSTVGSASASAASGLFPRSHNAPVRDDAAGNRYFWPCPAPRHRELSHEFGGAGRASCRLSVHAAEERVEWCEVGGIQGIPVRWEGCSPGCLAWLEEGEEEWDVESVNDGEVDGDTQTCEVGGVRF